MRWGWTPVVAACVVAGACGEAASPSDTSGSTTPPAEIIEPITAVAPSVVVDETTTLAPSTTVAPTGGVTPLDPGPLSARSDGTRVWTGSQLVVWGGVDPGGNPLDDGAVYDPPTKTWRSLPAAAWMTSVTDSVWDGAGILVLGTTTLTEVDVTTWVGRALAPPPYGSSFDVEWYVWTEGRLVVWLFDYTAFTTAVWQYDRAANDWHEVTPAPEAGVAAGRNIVGFEQADPSTTAAAPVKATVYDVVTGTLTTSTGPRRRTQAGALLAVGPDGKVYGWTEHHDEDARDPNAQAFTFDPATGEWADVPGTDLSLWECPAGTATAGRFIYLYDCGGTGRWFDTTTRTYTEVGSVAALPDVDGVWTGSELLLWGVPPCDDCDQAPPPSLVSLRPPG